MRPFLLPGPALATFILRPLPWPDWASYSPTISLGRCCPLDADQNHSIGKAWLTAEERPLCWPGMRQRIACLPSRPSRPLLRSSRRTTSMPDHACARSHQKQEIDQSPPPSSPSDPLGYIPYYLRFITRERRTHYPNVFTKNLIRALILFRSKVIQNVYSFKQNCSLYRRR